MKKINYEELFDNLDEGLKDAMKLGLEKSQTFAKDVWDSTKRESRETKEAVVLINRMLKGEEVTEDQKRFVKAQAVDIIKILPLVAIESIPVPVPITPLLIMVGKKVGFDFLPNSHTKAPCPGEKEE